MRVRNALLLFAPLLAHAQPAYPGTVGHLAVVQRVVDMGLVPPQDRPFRQRLSVQYVGPDSARIQRAFFQDPHLVADYPRGWLKTGEVFTVELQWNPKGRVGFFNKPLSIELSDGTWSVVHFRGRYATPEVMACLPNRHLPLLGEVHDPDSLAHWRAEAAAIDRLLAPDSLCPHLDRSADLTYLFTAVRGWRAHPVSGPQGMTSASEAIDQVFLGDGPLHTYCAQRWLDGLVPDEGTAPAVNHQPDLLRRPFLSFTQLSADGRYVVLVKRFANSAFLSGVDEQLRIYFRRAGDR